MFDADQHIATLVQHSVDRHRDGPWSFVVPAIGNSYYGRWWSPENEEAGGNRVAHSPLLWTGDYLDGFNNKITMHAYANPDATYFESQKDPHGESRRIWLSRRLGPDLFQEIHARSHF